MATTGAVDRPLEFRDLVRVTLADEVPPSTYVGDCFVTSELGHNDVIERCRPASRELGTGAYIGVGPCQNLTYVGALRPRLAVICDSRVDNLLEHLMFKLLVERAEDPLQYLCLLFSREVGRDAEGGRQPHGPEELVEEFERGAPDRRHHELTLAWMCREAVNRWALGRPHLDRLAYLYGRFFERQLDITAHPEECARALESPTLRDVILARTTQGGNYHFLADPDGFDHVRTMHLTDRIIPLVGNLCEPASIERVNRVLAAFGEPADTIYVSNVEDHVLGRYVLGPQGVASEPNPDGLLLGDHVRDYARFVACLETIDAKPGAMLIRFFYPAARWGRMAGAPPHLQPSVGRLTTFLRGYRDGCPSSLLDTHF